MSRVLIKNQYRCIGKGCCGSIWALEDGLDGYTQRIVVKRENAGSGRSVTNDYNMHLQFLYSAHRHIFTTPLLIPQCHDLIQPDDDTWWKQRRHKFPSGHSTCRALISERIPPVPRSISNKIVDLHCADNEKVANFVKSNKSDDDCLIRPYLGRRSRFGQKESSTSRFRGFTLRNVPLHIDEMISLSLDTKLYAEAMAEALALMHWGAGIDANDVEFVLAPPRKDQPQTPVFQSEFLGTHCIWVLDFDQCRTMQMNEVGVNTACAAFFRSDPYYPRPGTGEAAEEELWEAFKQKFVDCSRSIMGEGSKDKWLLAEGLIERIEREVESRRKNREAEIDALVH